MAWQQIEDEATRTIKRHLAGRRVVDVHGPGGFDLAAIGTGHLAGHAQLEDRTSVRLRAVQPLMELLTPFDVDRQAIDDVDRGAQDSDWQAVKDAAKQLAFAEDRAIFDGSAAGQIQGIRAGTSNPHGALPQDVRAYPDAIAQALSQLRLAGVNGPYRVALSADAYTAVSETSDPGYPILKHIRRLLSPPLTSAPPLAAPFSPPAPARHSPS